MIEQSVIRLDQESRERMARVYALLLAVAQERRRKGASRPAGADSRPLPPEH